jgi:hypothetical protein
MNKYIDNIYIDNVIHIKYQDTDIQPHWITSRDRTDGRTDRKFYAVRKWDRSLESTRHVLLKLGRGANRAEIFEANLKKHRNVDTSSLRKK